MPTLNKPLLIGLGFTGGATLGYAARDEIKKNVDYGSYLLRHKYHVYKGSRELGVPVGRALAHDISKFTPHEWVAYSNWFTGPEGLTGTRSKETFMAWRKAVGKHYKRNEHHWRKKGLTPNEVPMDVRLETLADWYGVQKARRTTTQSFKDWYQQRRDKFPIDNTTKAEADKRLGIKTAAKENKYTSLEYTITSGDPMIKAITARMSPDKQKAVWHRYAQIVLRNRNYGRKGKIADEFIRTKVKE
jgi:hypothetical protein